MKTKLAISLLAFGMAFGLSSSAMARGVSTFSGKSSPVLYGSVVKQRAVGERCRVTMCGRAPMSSFASDRGQAQASTVGERKSTGARLGVLPCHSTFCGRR